MPSATTNFCTLELDEIDSRSSVLHDTHRCFRRQQNQEGTAATLLLCGWAKRLIHEREGGQMWIFMKSHKYTRSKEVL